MLDLKFYTVLLIVNINTLITQKVFNIHRLNIKYR